MPASKASYPIDCKGVCLCMVGHGAFVVLAVAFCSACTWLLNEAEYIKQTLQHRVYREIGLL